MNDDTSDVHRIRSASPLRFLIALSRPPSPPPPRLPQDFPIRMNDLIAGRYQVMDFLGAAAFSRAVQALDVKTNTLVCLKIVKVRE